MGLELTAGQMFAASLATSAVGGIVQAAGASQAGNAAAQSAAYNAQIAENNRLIAEQNAEYATRAGVARAEQESLKGRVALGKIRAKRAASGVSIGSESAMDVEEGAREANVLDVANVIQNSQLEARGYRSQATSFEAEGNLARMRGASAKQAGKVGALGTLLSTAETLGSKWAMYGAGSGGSAWDNYDDFDYTSEFD